jgi:prophage antirepressor-like protein
MNALIDLTKCREYITVTIGGKNQQVKLNGTIDDPYFCHNELCAVLGYKDPKDALKRYVDGDDKINLKDLTNKLVGAAPTNLLGQINHNLNYHEGKASYISETGLYSLILSSQAPFAKEFKRLVCKTILPSIRKYGSYQVESQLTQAMEQLAIKEKSEEDLKREGEELRNKLVKAERKAIRVNKFMKRITIKERKMEWIYIATNDFYALERLWKVGSTIRLSSRIGGYHTGRAKGVGDGYYYVFAIKCYNSKDVDNHIQKLLADFKWKDPKQSEEQQNKDNRSEMYHGIKFTDLKDIVTFIVNNYDASVDYINNFIRTRLDQSLEEEDVIPPPLDFKRLTYQIGEHIETIDLEEEESESIREAFEDILTSIKEQHERNETVVIQRKDLMNRLVNVSNSNKKNLWSQIKELTGWANSKSELDDGNFKYKIVY